MVLGYFGKTPVEPEPMVVELAKKKLKLEPTTKSARELADEDPSKSLSSIKKLLDENNIEKSEENIFIVASCGHKGLKFLRGEGEVSIRKNDNLHTESKKGGSTFKTFVKTKVSAKIGENIYSEISGIVDKVYFKEGDIVKKGDVVLRLEAMKIQINVEAHIDGVIKHIFVKENDGVSSGEVLAVIS